MSEVDDTKIVDEANIFEGVASAIEARDLLQKKCREAADSLAGIPAELRDLTLEKVALNFRIGDLLYGIGQEEDSLATFGQNSLPEARAMLHLFEGSTEDVVINILRGKELKKLTDKQDELARASTDPGQPDDEYEDTIDEFQTEVEGLVKQYLTVLIRSQAAKVADLLHSTIYDREAIEGGISFSDYIGNYSGLGDLLRIKGALKGRP